MTTVIEPILERLALSLKRQIPIVLQTEAGECGLACIAMILSWHGHLIDLPSLREKSGAGSRGVTMRQLARLADSLRLSSRAVALEVAELKRLRLPCILHWDMNHFVVLTRIGRRGSTIVDPASGRRFASWREIGRRFTGVAIELWPNPAFRKQSNTRTIRLRTLLGRTVGLHRVLAKLFVLALALEGLSIIGPIVIQWVIDVAVVSQDEPLLTLLALGIALVTVVQVTIGLGRSWLLLYITTQFNVQLLASVFGHLLRLPLSWFESRHLGDIVSRFNAASMIQQTVTTGFIEALIDGVIAVTTLAMMMIYSPALTCIPLAALTVYALVKWLSYGALRQASGEAIQLQARQQSLLLESIRAVQAIKLAAHEDVRLARWLGALVDYTNRTLTVQKLGIALSSGYGLLFAAEGIAVLWLGALMVIRETFSVGMLFAFIAYKDNFSGRVFSLIEKFVQLVLLRLQGERLSDIVLSAPEPSASTLAEAPVQAGPIELVSVSFRYSPADPWIIRNFSMTIEAGEWVYLAGPSGCGKSTLLKLILGLLTPGEGEIRYAGRLITDIGLAQYRGTVGAVMQDDQLLRGSIYQNISFFAEAPDVQRIELCARSAAIHTEIVRMPMRYETQVTEMGGSLSGGQRQRILLARALYKDPRVLVLDEATSHLDPGNQSAILRMFALLSMTRLSVSHLPDAFTRCARRVELCATTA